MLLGFPTHVSKAYCTVTGPGGLVPSGFEASRLKNGEPSDTARISSLDPAYTKWKAAFGVSGGVIVEGIGVANVKISPSGLYRFVSNVVPGFTKTPPNAIVGSPTNVTGTASNVDEDISGVPDGSYIEPTNTALPWSVILGFPTPTDIPEPGTNKCMFVLRVQLVGTVATQYPLIQVYQRDAGIIGGMNLLLGSRPISVSAAGGQILVFSFTLVGLASGANVELRIDGLPGDGSTYCRLEAACFMSEIGVPYHDTGFLPSPTSAYPSDDPPPTISLSYFPPEPWANVSDITLMIVDDQTDPMDQGGDPLVGNVRRLPDGYIEAGTWMAGGVITIAGGGIKVGGGLGLEVLTEDLAGVTLAGQTFGADAFNRRSCTWDIHASRDVLEQLLDRLAWRLGHSGVVFIAAEPDIALSRQLFTSFLATCKVGKATPVTNDVGDGTATWSLVLEFEEKL